MTFAGFHALLNKIDRLIARAENFGYQDRQRERDRGRDRRRYREREMEKCH